MSYLGINPADSAVINKREYIATAGQTTFPCLYDEYVEVYLNGSRLAADDFTATDGMNVVLTLAAEADDVIVCSGYENARFDNSVSTTGTDTISGVKTFTAQPVGIVKTSVGLSNVDNTSDTDKPVSTATQTALNLKANQATTYTKAETDSKIVELAPMPDLSPYYTKTETDTAIANVVDAAPTTLNTLNELAAALGDDANFATTVTNSIATKAPLNSPTFTGTVGGISAIMVGLGNVMNESKSTMFASPTFTGTVSGITSTMVGLGNVTNESKATMFTSPTFTGTVSGVTKTMVGLGSVDNTSDSAKPVSTAQQTALDLKANLASPTFTGTVTAPTFSGALTGNATTATTSTNLANGSAGTIPYQTAANTTAQLAAGTSGNMLQCNGASAPSWVAPPSGGLQDTAHSFSENGYQKLSNGLIIQWGRAAVNASTTAATTISFPISFPNQVFSVTAIHQMAIAQYTTYVVWIGDTPTTSSFLAYYNKNSGGDTQAIVHYIAIGY
mgnify:CR=1 FL=1